MTWFLSISLLSFPLILQYYLSWASISNTSSRVVKINDCIHTSASTSTSFYCRVMGNSPMNYHFRLKHDALHASVLSGTKVEMLLYPYASNSMHCYYCMWMKIFLFSASFSGSTSTCVASPLSARVLLPNPSHFRSQQDRHKSKGRSVRFCSVIGGCSSDWICIESLYSGYFCGQAGQVNK